MIRGPLTLIVLPLDLTHTHTDNKELERIDSLLTNGVDPRRRRQPRPPRTP